jgi:hypothetical protein
MVKNFWCDPGMAKNLRADAIKGVQVFLIKETKLSSGIDDGETKKTINLRLKKGW